MHIACQISKLVALLMTHPNVMKCTYMHNLQDVIIFVDLVIVIYFVVEMFLKVHCNCVYVHKTKLSIERGKDHGELNFPGSKLPFYALILTLMCTMPAHPEDVFL